ncbi:hypothetical protein MLD38_020589 [Melastoma candidum]|uniref:Uncharacterized protein n=1 Tax=Melastoma candidum TaxID=119954 RepID=A0ACB9QLH2_9MYRT|nr:hypothetical protein MLD38_020589 [Melastoma candidum]
MSTGQESSGVETDLLSTLPKDIFDLLLCYLPIDDAVSTGILSKIWQHKWKTIPDVFFDTDCFAVVDDKVKASCNEQKLVEAINWVLENHSGEIIRFYVTHPNLNPVDDVIHEWIQRLSSCPLEVFALDLSARRHGRYKVHPALLKLKRLTVLELWCCSIDHFPATFGRLRNLKYLHLFLTPMSQDKFEYLVKSCPIWRWWSTETWSLISPLSRSMHRGSSLLRSQKSEKWPPVNACNLSGLFQILANLQTLHIKKNFLKYLIHRYVPERLSTPFPSMTWLAVETDPTSKKEIRGILCMLKSFPHLKRLTILFRGGRDLDEGAEKYFLHDEHKGLELPEVHLVEAVGFSDCFSELNLLELILPTSMNLRRLSVVDSISSKGSCPIEETTRRLKLVLGKAKATIVRRESCRGTCPTLVYMGLNDLKVSRIPASIIESPPNPQVI